MAPPRRSNRPVICRNACVGSTGNWLPARISGVAKSASDAANSSRNALAIPGMHSGSVTVRNTRHREAPSESAMPSMLESIAASMGRSVRYAMGKNVRTSDNSVE